MQQLTPKLEYDYLQEFSTAGITTIVGIDEVGRGAWAGPLVMAAYAINFASFPDLETHPTLEEVADSKKLPKAKREKIFSELQSQSNAAKISIAEVATSVISKKGLAWAIHQALANLVNDFDYTKTMFLLDGGLKPKLPVKYETIVKGDAQVYSIALAAIYAKVYRDNLLAKIAKKYPDYSFSTNVGYGTPQHREALAKFGPTP